MTKGLARRAGLTRTRSATAGESERGLQWTCFHKGKPGIEAASGWLHRLVRPFRDHGFFSATIVETFFSSSPGVPTYRV
jgi:hypothetical protein